MYDTDMTDVIDYQKEVLGICLVAGYKYSSVTMTDDIMFIGWSAPSAIGTGGIGAGGQIGNY
jgi:lipid-binding SYLF domain-containing protein